MQDLIIKIGMAMLTKLLTDKFLAKVLIRLMWYIADKTPFLLDDGIVEDTAKALDVTDYK